jgi:hypothetical protein
MLADFVFEILVVIGCLIDDWLVWGIWMVTLRYIVPNTRDGIPKSRTKYIGTKEKSETCNRLLWEGQGQSMSFIVLIILISEGTKFSCCPAYGEKCFPAFYVELPNFGQNADWNMTANPVWIGSCTCDKQQPGRGKKCITEHVQYPPHMYVPLLNQDVLVKTMDSADRSC